jgi:hypothetical protein
MDEAAKLAEFTRRTWNGVAGSLMAGELELPRGNPRPVTEAVARVIADPAITPAQAAEIAEEIVGPARAYGGEAPGEVYHGTTAQFEGEVRATSGEENLYGPGLYTTASEDLAAAYARGDGGRIYTMRPEIDPNTGAGATMFDLSKQAGGEDVRAAFGDNVASQVGDGYTSGHILYEVLQDVHGSKTAANQALRQAGYNGIVDPNARVLNFFDRSKLASADSDFTPMTQEQIARVQVHVDEPQASIYRADNPQEWARWVNEVTAEMPADNALISRRFLDSVPDYLRHDLMLTTAKGADGGAVAAGKTLGWYDGVQGVLDMTKDPDVTPHAIAHEFAHRASSFLTDAEVRELYQQYRAAIGERAEVKAGQAQADIEAGARPLRSDAQRTPGGRAEPYKYSQFTEWIAEELAPRFMDKSPAPKTGPLGKLADIGRNLWDAIYRAFTGDLRARPNSRRLAEIADDLMTGRTARTEQPGRVAQLTSMDNPNAAAVNELLEADRIVLTGDDIRRLAPDADPNLAYRLIDTATPDGNTTRLTLQEEVGPGQTGSAPFTVEVGRPLSSVIDELSPVDPDGLAALHGRPEPAQTLREAGAKQAAAEEPPLTNREVADLEVADVTPDMSRVRAEPEVPEPPRPEEPPRPPEEPPVPEEPAPRPEGTEARQEAISARVQEMLKERPPLAKPLATELALTGVGAGVGYYADGEEGAVRGAAIGGIFGLVPSGIMYRSAALDKAGAQAVEIWNEMGLHAIETANAARVGVDADDILETVRDMYVKAAADQGMRMAQRQELGDMITASGQIRNYVRGLPNPLADMDFSGVKREQGTVSQTVQGLKQMIDPEENAAARSVYNTAEARRLQRLDDIMQRGTMKDTDNLLTGEKIGTPDHEGIMLAESLQGTSMLVKKTKDWAPERKFQVALALHDPMFLRVMDPETAGVAAALRNVYTELGELSVRTGLLSPETVNRSAEHYMRQIWDLMPQTTGNEMVAATGMPFITFKAGFEKMRTYDDFVSALNDKWVLKDGKYVQEATGAVLPKEFDPAQIAFFHAKEVLGRAAMQEVATYLRHAEADGLPAIARSGWLEAQPDDVRARYTRGDSNRLVNGAWNDLQVKSQATDWKDTFRGMREEIRYFTRRLASGQKKLNGLARQRDATYKKLSNAQERLKARETTQADRRTALKESVDEARELLRMSEEELTELDSPNMVAHVRDEGGRILTGAEKNQLRQNLRALSRQLGDEHLDEILASGKELDVEQFGIVNLLDQALELSNRTNAMADDAVLASLLAEVSETMTSPTVRQRTLEARREVGAATRETTGFARELEQSAEKFGEAKTTPGLVRMEAEANRLSNLLDKLTDPDSALYQTTVRGQRLQLGEAQPLLVDILNTLKETQTGLRERFGTWRKEVNDTNYYIREDVFPVLAPYENVGFNPRNLLRLNNELKRTTLGGVFDLYMIGTTARTALGMSLPGVGVVDTADGVKMIGKSLRAAVDKVYRQKLAIELRDEIFELRRRGMGDSNDIREFTDSVLHSAPGFDEGDAATVFGNIPVAGKVYDDLTRGMEDVQFGGFVQSLKRQFGVYMAENLMKDRNAFTLGGPGNVAARMAVGGGLGAAIGGATGEDKDGALLGAALGAGVAATPVGRAGVRTQGMSKRAAYTKAARVMDMAFGGINFNIKGATPTAINAMRIGFLAPNWLLSRVQLYADILNVHDLDAFGRRWVAQTVTGSVLGTTMGIIATDAIVNDGDINWDTVDDRIRKSLSDVTDPHFLEFQGPDGQWVSPTTYEKDILRFPLGAFYLAQGLAGDADATEMARRHLAGYAQSRMGFIPRAILDLGMTNRDYLGRPITDGFSVKSIEGMLAYMARSYMPQWVAEPLRAIPDPFREDSTLGERAGIGRNTPEGMWLNLTGSGRGRIQNPLQVQFARDKASGEERFGFLGEYEEYWDMPTVQRSQYRNLRADKPDIFEYATQLPEGAEAASENVERAEADYAEATARFETGDIVLDDWRAASRRKSAASQQLSDAIFGLDNDRSEKDETDKLISGYYAAFDAKDELGATDWEEVARLQNEAMEAFPGGADEALALLNEFQAIGKSGPDLEYTRVMQTLRNDGYFDMDRVVPTYRDSKRPIPSGEWRSGMTYDELLDARSRLLGRINIIESDPELRDWFGRFSSKEDRYYIAVERMPEFADLDDDGRWAVIRDIANLTDTFAVNQEWQDYRDEHLYEMEWLNGNARYPDLQAMKRNYSPGRTETPTPTPAGSSEEVEPDKIRIGF